MWAGAVKIERIVATVQFFGYIENQNWPDNRIIIPEIRRNSFPPFEYTRLGPDNITGLSPTVASRPTLVVAIDDGVWLGAPTRPLIRIL